MLTIALVGADGAGKSTIARQVLRLLPPPARYMYMGVNLEASRVMLPTTRLLLELKRMSGGRPDMSAPVENDVAPSNGGYRVFRSIRTDLRYANLIAEEWFRQFVAWYYVRRGEIVIFDRHFVWDYHSSFSNPHNTAGSWMRRWHDQFLRRLYPRPDLVICLDAPAEVLFRRKGEGTLKDRERRRAEYLRLGAVTTNFVVVDVDRPSELVVREVANVILRACAGSLTPANRSDAGKS